MRRGAQRRFGISGWGAHLYARRGSDLRAVLGSFLPVFARLLQQSLLVLLLPPGRPAQRHPRLGNGPEVTIEEARYARHPPRRTFRGSGHANALRQSRSPEAFDAEVAPREPQGGRSPACLDLRRARSALALKVSEGQRRNIAKSKEIYRAARQLKIGVTGRTLREAAEGVSLRLFRDGIPRPLP